MKFSKRGSARLQILWRKKESLDKEQTRISALTEGTQYALSLKVNKTELCVCSIDLQLSKCSTVIQFTYWHFVNAYMWILEKWYTRAYLQSRNTDTDVEDKLMDSMGKMRWDELGNAHHL